jgi:hypothetical protein
VIVKANRALDATDFLGALARSVSARPSHGPRKDLSILTERGRRGQDDIFKDVDDVRDVHATLSASSEIGRDR